MHTGAHDSVPLCRCDGGTHRGPHQCHTGRARPLVPLSKRRGRRHVYPASPDAVAASGIAEDAAQELAFDPAVVGVGIDTISVGGSGDLGQDAVFRAHGILADANKYTVVNVGDMSRLPVTGSRSELQRERGSPLVQSHPDTTNLF